MSLTLYIGNKAYSSWSLRPWILMKQLGIPFDDVVIPLDRGSTTVDIQRHSPTGKVPVLATDGIVIWETLAIVEFLAERFPRFWIPDQIVFVDQIPLTSVGKFDKRALRGTPPVT